MKNRLLPATLVAAFLAQASYAACYNWEERDYENPEFHLICFKDKCDIARINFVCSLHDDAWAGYEVGWEIGTTAGGTQKYVNWEGRRLPTDQYEHLRCFEFSDDTLTRIVGDGRCWGNLKD